MFYALEILAKKGPLAPMWLAGMMPSKLKRKQILAADIPALVIQVLRPEVALSQRTSAILLHGAARIWQVQAKALLHDCTNLSSMVLRKTNDDTCIDMVPLLCGEIVDGIPVPANCLYFVTPKIARPPPTCAISPDFPGHARGGPGI